MKNFIGFIIFLCLMFNCSFAKDVKFVFLSDAAINVQNPKTISDFKKTIKEINSYNDLDFVVIGGNNISKATKYNLKQFCSLIKKINKKTYVLLGSSDVAAANEMNKKYYLNKIKLARFLNHSSKTNYTFKTKGYRFVVMDGSKQYFQSSNGYYDKNELLWLDKTLSKYEKEDVIILQHFPILPSKSDWKTTAKIENYAEVLKKHNNVKVIVSGHYNANLETKTGNITHILTQNYQPDCAYKIIEINLDDNFIGTYLVK